MPLATVCGVTNKNKSETYLQKYMYFSNVFFISVCKASHHMIYYLHIRKNFKYRVDNFTLDIYNINIIALI